MNSASELGDEPKPPAPDNGADPNSSAVPAVDADLTIQETVQGPRAGDQYVRVERPYLRLFHRVSPGYLRATEETLEPRGPAGRMRTGLLRFLIGAPLASEREIHERLSKVKALAVFASDAISSTAYATQEILFVLMLAGTAALSLSVPISLSIAILLCLVAFSYRQTIFAYPRGGGSYMVTRENIGNWAGLVSASSLMLGYVLTVAVSISAGTDAITSAFPALDGLSVPISLFFIGLIALGNLRGIREAGTLFALPTYAFIFGLLGVLGMGFFRLFLNAGPVEPVAANPAAVEPLSIWLILTAFSAGAVAMSGTEAIADGVPAFKPPESKNAATTLTVMAILLGSFFVAISVLAWQYQIASSHEETVISQLGRAAFGLSPFYYYMQFATMGILVIGANTAYADFPRLSSFLARDDFMPHSFGLRGDRLAFTTGIVVLSMLAALLIVIAQGDTHSLIPLYAVGVFLSFTMSQTGMIMHWRKQGGPNWKRQAAINGLGAVLSGLVLLISGVTKFVHGAWIIIVAIPVLVFLFFSIQHHYHKVDRALALNARRRVPHTLKLRVLVVVPSVNYATERALAFARSISGEITAVTVAFTREQAENVRTKLRIQDPDIRLVVLEDPYRDFYHPLTRYIESLHERDPETFITVVIPEFTVSHWWEALLHNRAAQRLNRIFRRHQNVAIVNVPYVIEESKDSVE